HVVACDRLVARLAVAREVAAVAAHARHGAIVVAGEAFGVLQDVPLFALEALVAFGVDGAQLPDPGAAHRCRRRLARNCRLAHVAELGSGERARSTVAAAHQRLAGLGSPAQRQSGTAQHADVGDEVARAVVAGAGLRLEADFAQGDVLAFDLAGDAHARGL